MDVMHFKTHFTHVYRYFKVYCKKQQKMFRENCFENEVSGVLKKCQSSTKLLLGKVRKLKKKKN